MSVVFKKDQGDKEAKKKIMGKLKDEKVIAMSVDPGYDSYKIVVNGEMVMSMFSLALHPEAKEKISEAVYERNTSSVVMRNKEGEFEEFIMGEEVNTILASENVSPKNRAIIEAAEEKVGRFNTDAFKASMVMAIITALHEYACRPNSVGFNQRDVDLSEWRLDLVVELPAEFVDEVAPIVKGMFEEPFDADVTVGKTKYRLAKFDLNQYHGRILCAKQVMAAYNNMVFSPFHGRRSDEEMDKRRAESPALVLDFGRKTFGAKVVNRTASITDAKDIGVDPNSFAMLRFESETADIINREYGQRLRKPVLAASIGMYCDGVETLSAYREDGRGAEKIDVREIRRAVIDSHIDELISYIDKSFDILNMHSILICGGTGSVLEDDIRRAYNPRDYGNIRSIRLLDAYGFGPVYAVAFGGYCELITRFMSNK